MNLTPPNNACHKHVVAKRKFCAHVNVKDRKDSARTLRDFFIPLSMLNECNYYIQSCIWVKIWLSILSQHRFSSQSCQSRCKSRFDGRKPPGLCTLAQICGSLKIPLCQKGIVRFYVDTIQHWNSNLFIQHSNSPQRGGFFFSATELASS